MSRYANDERVKWPSAGTPSDVLAQIPDPADSDGRIVMAHQGGYVVRGAVDQILTKRDTSGLPAVFATVDHAIYAVIGPPQ